MRPWRPQTYTAAHERQLRGPRAMAAMARMDIFGRGRRWFRVSWFRVLFNAIYEMTFSVRRTMKRGDDGRA